MTMADESESRGKDELDDMNDAAKRFTSKEEQILQIFSVTWIKKNQNK